MMCSKPPPGSDLTRKKTFRHKPLARRAGEVQCLGEMPWDKPGDCGLSPTPHHLVEVCRKVKIRRRRASAQSRSMAGRANTRDDADCRLLRHLEPVGSTPEDGSPAPSGDPCQPSPSKPACPSRSARRTLRWRRSIGPWRVVKSLASPLTETCRLDILLWILVRGI